MKNNRVSWITNLKGFAILMVVLGHLGTPLTGFLFSWHIPLLFFLSGYVINITNFKVLITKDFKRLVLPYVLFGLTGILVEYLKRVFWPDWNFMYQTFSIGRELKALFIWMDAGIIHTYGFVLWFIPALLWSKYLLIIFKNIIHNNYLSVVLGVGLWFLLINQKYVWWFGFDKALISFIWVSFGYLFRHNLEVHLNLPKIAIYIMVIIFYIIPNPKLDMAQKIASDPLYNLIYAGSFIQFLILIFKQYNFLDGFKIWGEFSMMIYVIHPYIDNLAYIFIILVLHSSWIIEYAFSVILLFILIKSRKIFYENNL